MKQPIGDMDRLPPITYDAEGYPFLKVISRERRRVLTEIQRKVRFLIAYNTFAGNDVKACEEAGVPLSRYKEWLQNDPKFAEKFGEQIECIVARIKDVLSSRIGLIKPDKRYAKVSDYVLLTLWQKLKPSDFDGESIPGNVSGVKVSFGIPRPTRPGADPLRADPKAGPIPPVSG